MAVWSFLATTWWIYWGQLFRSLGNRLAWREGYLLAVACFTRGLRHAPHHASLYFWRGTLHWRELGNSPQAETDLSQAIALAPQMARAYLNRAFARWYAIPPDRVGAAEDFRAYLARSNDPYWRGVAQEHLQQLP